MASGAYHFPRDHIALESEVRVVVGVASRAVFPSSLVQLKR